MDKLLKAVQATVKKYNMLGAADKITVALSGGADSVVLTHALYCLRGLYGYQMSAVHLNHNLRGEESMRDEQFVRDFCRRLNIPLTVYSEDILSGAKAAKRGVEEYARERRYTLFGDLCESTDSLLATAHNADDAAETLIFNITRGSGIAGLCALKPVRGNIIRPLINVSRAEIERYAAENALDFVTDSTNLSDDYTRNNIRHNILPQLKAINPSFLSAASRLADSSRSADEYIAEQAAALIDDADVKTLCNQHDAVLAEYIRRLCERQLGKTPEYSQISDALHIIRKGSGSVSISGGNHLYIENGKVIIGLPQQNDDKPFCVPFDTGKVKTPHNEYTFSVCDIKEYENQRKINNLLLKNALDYDKMGNSLVLRSKSAGDKAILCGRGCTKSLKKLFCEMKIPLDLRNRLAVLSNDKQDVLWVEDFGACECVRVDENTKRVLMIEYVKQE
ncbi:MAG: tRNA lysidine(34) synthetase TilS [Acutalibacteraceae bacterium]